MAVGGIPELLQNLSRYAKEKVDAIYQAAGAVQAMVVNDAQTIVPKRTRNLMKSIRAGIVRVDDERVEAQIVAGADYASYVEEGTSRQKPQPYLAPSLLKNQRTFISAIKRAMK